MTTVSVVSMTKGCYKNCYAFRAYGKTSACKWHNSYRARGPLVTRLKEPHPTFCSSTFHVRRLRKIQYFVTRKLFDQRGYIIMQFSRRTPVRDASLLLYKLRQEDRIRKKRKQRGQDKARKTRKKVEGRLGKLSRKEEVLDTGTQGVLHRLLAIVRRASRSLVRLE